MATMASCDYWLNKTAMPSTSQTQHYFLNAPSKIIKRASRPNLINKIQTKKKKKRQKILKLMKTKTITVNRPYLINDFSFKKEKNSSSEMRGKTLM